MRQICNTLILLIGILYNLVDQIHSSTNIHTNKFFCLLILEITYQIKKIKLATYTNDQFKNKHYVREQKT